jgi:acetyl esterase/lipase
MKSKFSFVFFLLNVIFQLMYSQTVLPLYPDSIPNSKPVVDEEQSEFANGITTIRNVSTPTLTVFLPAKEKANGTAVVICPGGGYWVVTMDMEGTDVAKKFTEMGVAAIVLKYRIPNSKWMINKEIGPLQDAQQAIKTVRDNADKWNINPNRIGIMGFSAGGHLASTAAIHFNKPYISNTSNTSLRPDFMMLIYPVINLMPGIGHMGSSEQLLGRRALPEKLKEYSNELQVTAETPPAFLVHASDDDGVSPMNSIVFYDSLISKKIPAELHIYQSGGHGFGMYIKNNQELWMDRCKSWMQLNGWVKKDNG